MNDDYQADEDRRPSRSRSRRSANQGAHLLPARTLAPVQKSRPVAALPMLGRVNAYQLPEGRVQFVRTIRLPGCEPKLLRFSPGEQIELSEAEVACLAPDISNGMIHRIGSPQPEELRREPPRLDPREDERDENFDRIPPDATRGWHRFVPANFLNWSGLRR